MTNHVQAWSTIKPPTVEQFEQMELFPKADDLQVSGNHYKDMGIQPWTVMEAILTREEFIGYLKGNVIKYAMRQGKKEGSHDAGKALHYKHKLEEILEKKS